MNRNLLCIVGSLAASIGVLLPGEWLIFVPLGVAIHAVAVLWRPSVKPQPIAPPAVPPLYRGRSIGRTIKPAAMPGDPLPRPGEVLRSRVRE
jgi:hypothetical protein